MSTFVLIPGAWLGGWAWQRLTLLLRAGGHDVYPITLTGLGERVHLARPDVGLETHVQDVVNVIEYEDLQDVALLGHSYAGKVAGCVAARIPERIAQVIYLATEPPVDGRSLADDWSAEGWAWVEQSARDAGEPWRWPMPANLGEINETSVIGLSEADLTWLHAKSAPHPLKTMTDAASVPESG
ncbi:MAG TPA: alpha/beta hydrolase [Thermomicrobiales bacterium]|nr:alpha/beta hydrolase [Thermomicrobiales bacterium]